MKLYRQHCAADRGEAFGDLTAIFPALSQMDRVESLIAQATAYSVRRR